MHSSGCFYSSALSPLELEDNIITSGQHSLRPGLCCRTRTETGTRASRGQDEERALSLPFIHITEVIIPASISVLGSRLKSERVRRTFSRWKLGAEMKGYSQRLWRVHSWTRHVHFHILLLSEKGFDNTGSDGFELILKNFFLPEMSFFSYSKGR